MISLPPLSLPLLASLAVVAAAAAAVIVRDGRAVALGVFAALIASPFATEPVPGGLQLAARAVAAVMAGYVLWVAMKGGAVKSEGSAIGPVAELVVAAGAYALGWWIRPVDPLVAPQAEQAAGFAVVVLAIVPLAGSNPLRAGIGVFFVILGASMVMDAWLGQMPALGQLALTALLLAIPGAISMVVDAEDTAAPVIPAVEQVRPAQPAPVPRVDPFGGGDVEPILAEPYPTFSPIERDEREIAAEAADAAEEGAYETDIEAEADREDEVARGAEHPAAPTQLPMAEPSDGEPLTHVTGPRPSVRFLGRNAPLRHPSDASQARRPGERRLPGLGRRSDGGHAAPEPEPADAADAADPANKLEKGLGEEGLGDSGPRENRRLRDPRFKRPLR